jgi:SPP1 gp7 family putative phage head morphogenesis protein
VTSKAVRDAIQAAMDQPLARPKKKRKATKSGVPHTADTPSDEAIAERGREYWRTHVAWGHPGDFMECVRGVMEHAGMSEANAKGYCNLRHHEVTGEYAGRGAHKFVDATVLKMVEVEIGKTVPGERAEHKPPGFGTPRDNRRRFRAGVGKPGVHGGFSPGERDHEPLQVGSEHDLNDVDMDVVENRRHRAPGEDGHNPNEAGDGIPADTNDPRENSQHVVADAIHDHENGSDIGSGNLPKALGPGRATRDFPGWRYDQALAIHYSRTLAACGVLVDTEAIADQWLRANKAEGQTPPGGDPKPWVAAQVARWSVSLRQMLNELWREGWFLGAKSGRAVVAAKDPDWGDWSPGNPTAARIVRTSKDLRRWLNTYGVATIRSIEDNRMNELAKALHLSLKEGWASDTLARYIENILINPNRARMIARTETARAVSQGTLSEYRHADVGRVQWVTADDTTVCVPCDANEAMGAIPTGSVFGGTSTDAPPGHPNCRCAIIAVPDGMEVPPRAVTKVGPKGYVHGWIFVGAPGVGGRVFHPHHGHGTVAEHRGDSASVHFDGGHKAEFVTGHHNGSARIERVPGLSGDEAFESVPRFHRRKLTDEQDEALDLYTRSGYVPINKHLRHGAAASDEDKSTIRELDGLFDLVPALERPIEVHRGFRDADTVFGASGSKVGETFVDKAFASSTTDRSITVGFTHGPTPGVVTKIHVPAGRKAIRPSVSLDYFAGEHEVLLPRETRFRVISDNGEGSDRVIELEVL